MAKTSSWELLGLCALLGVGAFGCQGSGDTVLVGTLVPPIASPAPAPALAPAPGPAKWDDAWWLERASRALRGGDSLAPSEDPSTLLTSGREAAVQKFLADPRFADSMLGFNLYLLGFRVDRVKKENGLYQDIIYELPHALSSARSLLQPGGDYFSLFDLKQPLFLGPLPRPGNIDPTDAQVAPEALWQLHFTRIQADLDALIALAQAPTPDTVAICTAFNNHTLKYLFSGVLRLPPTFYRQTMFVQNWYGLMQNVCGGATVVGFNPLTELQKIKAQNTLFFAKLVTFFPSVYKASDLSQFKGLDLADMNLGFVNSPFTDTVQRTLPNSSTNYDRKRSAYILKRFFCDDLTPVNVEVPAAHAGGAHASEPACMACHYKLDPMAGFFRDLGRNYRDFSTRTNITLDDGVQLPRLDYEKAWQPGPDAAHPWNVGIIRSTTDLTLNTYGSTVADLYAALRTAPEVRRCVARRMFEYLVSDKQAADGDYLDYLTDSFSSDLAQKGSGDAVRGMAARIVLSNSFGTRNADPGSCYDYRPGHTAASDAPCKIASILAKNCVTCHDSTTKKPFLDFTGWALQSDGRLGFPHLGPDGKPVPGLTTFQQMLDRISSTNDDLRMPQLGEMPVTERADLYTWLDSQLATHGGNGP